LPKLDGQSDDVKSIDKTLADWSQGDMALDEHWFIYAADPSRALTDESGQAQGNLQTISSEVEGLIILTQSCDIVRPCLDRPFLEVAPLEKVSAGMLNEIKRGMRPAYAYLPVVAHNNLVAHLDRVMTVEKSVVASWVKTRGLTNEEEAHEFSEALTRKRARFAFPDDFNDFVGNLHKHLRRKHDKTTDEGTALRDLQEIRVSAAPNWEAPAGVELFFWFIRKGEEPVIPSGIWTARLDSWKKLIPPKGRFTQVEGQIVSLEDITALDYLGSEHLDLDYLSGQDD
jgi:hypothetical protein